MNALKNRAMPLPISSLPSPIPIPVIHSLRTAAVVIRRLTNCGTDREAAKPERGRLQRWRGSIATPNPGTSGG